MGMDTVAATAMVMVMVMEVSCKKIVDKFYLWQIATEPSSQYYWFGVISNDKILELFS